MKTITYNPDTHRLVPVEVEPVGHYLGENRDGADCIYLYRDIRKNEHLYTAPPSCDACKSNKQDYAALKQQLEEIKRQLKVMREQRDELMEMLEKVAAFAVGG